MADISLADIKKLRDMTSAGMMDCKKALTEAEGEANPPSPSAVTMKPPRAPSFPA